MWFLCIIFLIFTSITTTNAATSKILHEIFSSKVDTNTGPIIRIENGFIEGSRDETLGVDNFFEIPFITPPIGSLRWRSPQPHENWKGIRDATHNVKKTLCPQVTFPLFGYGDRGEMTEDCIKLNIEKPILTSTSTEEQNLLPVYVWIHGGGNWFGGIHHTNYNGSTIITKGQFILVKIAYRLGPFGMFAHEGLHSNSLNLGFFAEKKVGAVIALMTSPLAKGLFHGGIAQSPMPGHVFMSIEDANHIRGQKVSANVNCNIQQNLEEELSCLRGKSWEDILNGIWTLDGLTYIQKGGLDAQLGYSYILDQHVLPYHSPLEAFQSGDFNKVPLIIGSTNQELTFIFQGLPASVESFKAMIATTFGPTYVDRFVEVYNPQDNPLKAFTEIVQHRAQDCYIEEISQVIASHSVSVNRYLLTHVISAIKEGVGAFGSPHFSDIPLFFDTEEFGYTSNNPIVYDEKDRQVSNLLQAFWILFIHGYTQQQDNIPNLSLDIINKFSSSSNLPFSSLPYWKQVTSLSAPLLDLSIESNIIEDYNKKFCELIKQVPHGMDFYFPSQTNNNIEEENKKEDL